MKCVSDTLRLVANAKQAYRSQIWDSDGLETFRVAVPNTIQLDTIAITNTETSTPIVYTIISPPVNPFPLNGKTKVTVDEMHTGTLIELNDKYVVVFADGKALRINNYVTLSSDVKLDTRYLYLHIHDAKCPIALNYSIPNLSWLGYYATFVKEKSLNLRYVGRLENNTGFSFTPTSLSLETADGSTYQLTKPTVESFGTTLCPLLITLNDIGYQKICRYTIGSEPVSCFRFTTSADLPKGECTIYDEDGYVATCKIDTSKASEDVDLVLGVNTFVRATGKKEPTTKEKRQIDDQETEIDKVEFSTEFYNDNEENVILVVRLDIAGKSILSCTAQRYEKRGNYVEFFLELPSKSGSAVFSGTLELISS